MPSEKLCFHKKHFLENCINFYIKTAKIISKMSQSMWEIYQHSKNKVEILKFYDVCKTVGLGVKQTIYKN